MANFMFIIINWCFTVDLFICILVITTVGFDIFCPLIHLLSSYFLQRFICWIFIFYSSKIFSENGPDAFVVPPIPLHLSVKRLFTLFWSNPRLLSAFSSNPCSIFGFRPRSLGSRPLENVEVGRDIWVDVALVGSVENDEVLFAELLLDGEAAAAEDPAADYPNILGSRPNNLGSIPPRSILGSMPANSLGS